MSKFCYILRGVPGCGKSTVAKSIAGDNGIICEADKFFMEDGKYNFNPSNLGKAHAWCFSTFKKAIDNDVEKVIVSNTSTKQEQFEHYKNYAGDNDYTVMVMTIENHHGNKDAHGVPYHVIKKMEKNLKDSIKLT